MTNQEHIILILSILCGILAYYILFLYKKCKEFYEYTTKELSEQKNHFRKEFERVRFTEKPICKVGDIYSKKFVVTKAKYVEYPNVLHPNLQQIFLLQITNEYELLNLETKETTHFRSNYFMQKFIKDNDLKITKIG